jgi:hypothetical protein
MLSVRTLHPRRNCRPRLERLAKDASTQTLRVPVAPIIFVGARIASDATNVEGNDEK